MAPNADGESPSEETYNPWTIVNVAFHHLVENGCHPTLGDGGDPGEPAAALLRALGITPTVEGDARASQDMRDHLSDLRRAMLDGP
ncbi:MAG TPA: hypothetical protein VF053_03135 [Streptosporangiales bacterium]